MGRLEKKRGERLHELFGAAKLLAVNVDFGVPIGVTRFPLYHFQTEDDPDMGAGYSTWLTTVRAGLAALEASGEVSRLAGMIWMQGESDAPDLSMAAVYEDNLRNLIARVRQDTGEPALPFALGLIDCIPCGSGRNLVRAAQQLVADEDRMLRLTQRPNVSQKIEQKLDDRLGRLV